MDYRTTPRACLACATPLEPVGRRLACPGCRSCLVPIADVEAAWRAMANAGKQVPPFQLEPLTGGFARLRPCPQCSAAMTPCTLVMIPIDRCDAHGLWFDHDELERALFAAAPEETDEPLGVVKTTGGVVEGLGTVLEILGIFAF